MQNAILISKGEFEQIIEDAVLKALKNSKSASQDHFSNARVAEEEYLTQSQVVRYTISHWR